MLKQYYMSEDVYEALQQFFTSHDIALLNQNMRRQLLDFLDHELETGVPLYFDTFLFTYNCLLDVLDIAARDINAFGVSQRKDTQSITHKTAKEKVLYFIQTALSPEKIFLLCHTTTANNIEYFDLLVTIPESSQTGFSNYEQIISMANIENAAIHVSMHKSGMLQNQLEDGHIFYSIACNKQNLVYKNCETVFPEPKPGMLKALAERASIEFYISHKKAESFLQGASNYVGENDKEMAAFMLQQAVELTLRGLITALTGNCAKTHCFNELKKPLKRYIPELRYLFSAEEAEETRLLNLLGKAYLEARYTNRFTITGNDLHLLTEGAENLHETAEKLFKQKIAVISKQV